MTMNTFGQTGLRVLLSSFISFTGFFIYLIGVDFSFPSSFLLSIGTGVVTYFVIKQLQFRWWLKKQALTVKDFRYIKKNLKEAKEKIKRLQKQQLKVRSLGAFKQVFELNRLTRRIFTIVQKQPKRFYLAESFFFYHLDSVVELSEKYTFLAAQPGKNKEVFLSLQQTRSTLDDLIDSLEKDLHAVLSEDMDTLQYELKFAEHHLSNKK
jgi:5-bromo-4-chloroindolyl phosphate hydrolysis protein